MPPGKHLGRTWLRLSFPLCLANASTVVSVHSIDWLRKFFTYMRRCDKAAIKINWKFAESDAPAYSGSFAPLLLEVLTPQFRSTDPTYVKNIPEY
jgi:hypothetical protein